MRTLIHWIVIFLIVSAILSFFPGLNLIDRFRGE